MVAGQVRTTEKIIAGIASRAHGVATRTELTEAGLSKDEIDWRLGAGALIRIHRDDVFVRPETVIRELGGLLVAYRQPLWSSSR